MTPAQNPKPVADPGSPAVTSERPGPAECPENPLVAFGLLGVVAVAAVLTGFHGGHLPIFLAESVAGLFLLWRLRRCSLVAVWKPYLDGVAGMLWLLLSLVIAALQIALGITSSLWETHRQLHFFATALLLTPLIASAMPTIRTRRGALVVTCLLAGLFLVSLLATTWAARQPGAASQALVWWPFVYRNHYAAFALLALPALLWAAMHSGELRWPALFAIVFAVAGVLSCGSRSGFLGLLAIAVCFPVLMLRDAPRRRPATWTLLAFPAVVAAVALLASPDLLVWRWQHSGWLLEGRVEYWGATIRMIAERPLAGWGFGTWPDVFRQFMESDPGLVVNRAHSDFLEFAAEGGVLVLLSLAGLFLRSVWLACRLPWALGLPVLLGLAMTDYPLRLPLLLWDFLALYLAAETEVRGGASLPLPAVLRLQHRAGAIAVKPGPGVGATLQHGVPECGADRQNGPVMVRVSGHAVSRQSTVGKRAVLRGMQD